MELQQSDFLSSQSAFNLAVSRWFSTKAGATTFQAAGKVTFPKMTTRHPQARALLRGPTGGKDDLLPVQRQCQRQNASPTPVRNPGEFCTRTLHL